MKYQITSDNIEISDSMKSLAKEKFEKIEKRLMEKERSIAFVRMVLNKGQEEDMFEVKIELAIGGKKYFSHDKNFVLESAIIGSINQLERMRRKEDISYYSDWKKQRSLKRRYQGDLDSEIDHFLDEDE